jgi:eukaryotic-like serine/threonine-protein kinase
MIGQSISHYKIIEKLGEGGMGVVYKAQDTKLNRSVALKFLPPHLSASEVDKARFIQEAQAASALNHPNVCTIHDIQDHGGQMFIVMEFVDGETLRERKANINFKQGLEIGIQIAEGLAAAHERGIVHRDIKPDNIMIRKDGIAQIMDFGLAKLRGVSKLTKEGSTIGTAGYMSPEQIQGMDTDHRSDIFSFGVLFFELLTGQLPFRGVHETALAYEIVNVDALPMSSIRSDIDPALDAIVLECLEKDPNERTQSIKQVAIDLKRYRRESSRQKMSGVTAAHPAQRLGSSQHDAHTDVAGSAPAMLPESRAGMKWIPWSVAFFFILAFSVLAFIHLGETRPDTPSINAAIVPPPGYSFNNAIGGHMALSPDGTLLAFVAADSAGTTTLWVRPLNSSSARQLAETNGAHFPFWSPDNNFIGFFSNGKLRKVLASGAPPIDICDAPDGRGGTWNQDGIILYSPNFDRVPIYRVSASGGVSTPVTRIDSTRNETNHRWPLFLPDGKHFIYTTQGSHRNADYAGAMYVSSLDGLMNKLLLNASSNMSYFGRNLLYVRHNSVVAQPFDLSKLELFGDATPVVEKVEFSGDKSRGVFSISNTGILVYQTSGTNASALSLYDREGKEISNMGGRSVGYGARFSPDGTKVTFDSPDPETGYGDIWIYDISRKISSRFTFDQSAEWQPIWSPDGMRVAYSSDKQGSGDLSVKNSDGTESEQIVLKPLSTNTGVLDWSPDGRYIMYSTANENSSMGLWYVPLEGKHEPFRFVDTKFTEDFARFSPDGHWVVYQSDESGKTEIYVRPFPAGSGKWQISGNGGANPIWSGDGKEIYYNSGAGTVMMVDVKTAGTAFFSGAPRMLFAVSRGSVLDVSRDGNRFLVSAVAGPDAFQPITLVTNWNKELKKK